MQLPKSEQLNIASLSRLFDNKAECYKLFWFQAILNHVCNGQQEIRFEELIDDMIANAWYMVTEYHLNLGPGNGSWRRLKIIGICIPPPGPSTAARAIVCRSGSCIFRALPVWNICRIR